MCTELHVGFVVTFDVVLHPILYETWFHTSFDFFGVFFRMGLQNAFEFVLCEFSSQGGLDFCVKWVLFVWSF